VRGEQPEDRDAAIKRQRDSAAGANIVATTSGIQRCTYCNTLFVDVWDDRTLRTRKVIVSSFDDAKSEIHWLDPKTHNYGLGLPSRTL
jgi:hypothetical protein